MKIKEGKVIAKASIGNISLNTTKEELVDIIGKEYEEERIGIGELISIENAKFWIGIDGRVDQIGVTKGFKGKYKNYIGIGSTLTDVKEKVGNFVEKGYTYEMENEQGICFELEDIDNWEELAAPIEYIYVFRV